MATAGLTEDVLRAEMLAVVTSFTEVNAFQFREVVRQKWEQIGAHMDNCTMLVIGGIHGDKHGNLKGLEGNMKTLKRQVRFTM